MPMSTPRAAQRPRGVPFEVTDCNGFAMPTAASAVLSWRRRPGSACASPLTVPHTVVRKFAIILCTDFVNSTKQAAAAGDTAWRETMEGHDRLTRDLVGRHGGLVVGSTGDGLLATFDVPSQAVPCGVEMLKALADIGVTIRAGVHAGEIGIIEGDITGIAVNLATRVSQKAADGEFWVSSTVRDMMLGDRTAFADRGQHALKGFDEPWRLYRVGRS